MLSKVAERIYWTARYLERVEYTTRLIGIYANLLMDLPKGVQLGWYNLVALNSLQSIFEERYKIQDERNVIKFLLGDENNPSSVVSSLRLLRENVRTTRDVIPAETWELINELNIYISENLPKAVNRGQRAEVIEEIIRGCQSINGLLYGSMPHDNAWDFLRLGRNLERADMTSRILDAGCFASLETQDEEVAVNSWQIIWGNVLRSVGADHSYRRKLRRTIKGRHVAQYLLEDTQFPRAVAHCLWAISDSCGKLPRNEPVCQAVEALRNKAFKKVDYKDLRQPMRDYLNTLQIELGNLHAAFAKQWFH